MRVSEASILRPYLTGILEVSARRGRENALSELLRAMCGFALPAPGRSEISTLDTALWIAPATFLFLAAEARCAEIGAAVPADVAAINDQSAGYEAMMLDMSAGSLPLASLCRLDLSKFAVGHATRTPLGQIPAVLWRPEHDRYGILVPRTLARTFI
ncbi:unnamed protein product, partial [Phaeothamnion confervicola]